MMSWEIEQNSWSIFEWKWKERTNEFIISSRKRSPRIEWLRNHSEDYETSLFPGWRTESKRDQNSCMVERARNSRKEREGKKRDAVTNDGIWTKSKLTSFVNRRSETDIRAWTILRIIGCAEYLTWYDIKYKVQETQQGLLISLNNPRAMRCMTRINGSARTRGGGRWKIWRFLANKRGRKRVSRAFIIKDTRLGCGCFWIPGKHADVARDGAVLRSPRKTLSLSLPLSLVPGWGAAERERRQPRPQRIVLKRILARR